MDLTNIGTINGGSPVTGGPFLPLTGGTLTGQVNVDADFKVRGASGEDHFVIAPQAAGTGIYLLSLSNDENTYEPLRIDAESYNFTASGTSVISTSGLNTTFAGDINLNNGNGIIIKDNGGAFRDVIKLATNNQIQIGSSAIGANIRFLNTGNYTFENGNVGIGTTSPGSKLTVNESSTAPPAVSIVTARYGISLQGAGTSNSQYLLNLQSNGGATDVMRVQSSGNVGIGTTSPSQKLHVHSTSGDALVRVSGDNILNSGGEIKGFNNGFAFNVAPSGGGTYVERMRINGLGNVGIGTASPAKKLVVKSSGADDGIVVLRNATSGVIASVIETGSGDGALILANNSAATSVLLRGSGDNYINSGNVGIGTTSPSGKLHVNDGTNRNIRIRTDQGVQGTTGMAIQSFNDAVSANMPLSISGSVIALMEGNVGIGTTSPGEKLDVTGNIKGSTTMTAGYTVASLPSGAAAKIGMRAYVTDGTSISWGGTVTDAGVGGAFAPVMYDGTNWKYY